MKFRKKKMTRTSAVKFLGVLRDAHLSWKPHITELSKKLARTVGILCKVSVVFLKGQCLAL